MCDGDNNVGVQFAYLVRALRRIAAEGLTVWSQGNASVFLPEQDLVLIKASGIECARAGPQSLVALHGDGQRFKECEDDPDLKPSTDYLSHRYIYDHLGDEAAGGIRAIVHTHSTFATARATGGMGIPCVLTSIADEFGGPIPCLPYATIGGDEIGRGVVSAWLNARARGLRPPKAMLLQNHGVLTVGRTLGEAVKAAVMCEDCARTMHFAEEYHPSVLSQGEIDKAHRRYTTDYGQGK